MKFPKFMRIAVVPVASILNIKKTEDGKVEISGGPEGKLIKALAQALKFNYELITTSWGGLVNGTLTGGIGMVYRNEADLAVGKYATTEERLRYIDYTYPHLIEDFTFAIQKPGLKSPVDAYIRPFTSKLWLVTVSATIIMTIIFSLFYKIGISKSIEQVIGIFTTQSIKTKQESFKEKLVVSTWAWGTLILSYSYVAVLLSFLTIPILEKEPTNFEELAEAVTAGTHKAMTFKGTMILSELLLSTTKNTLIIAKNIEKNNYLVATNREHIVKALRKEKVALISPKSSLRFFVQNEFFISDDSLKSTAAGIVISKTFCCKYEIEKFVHAFTAAGLYKKYIDDDIFQTGLKSNTLDVSDPTESKLRPLSISDVSGAFILLVIGHTIASITAIVEIIYNKINNKNKNFEIAKDIINFKQPINRFHL